MSPDWHIHDRFILSLRPVCSSASEFRVSRYYGRWIVTLGAAVAATLMIHGTSPILASLAAFGAGMIAGACTGTLYTRFKINSLLSGILVMTALYSINLHIMGQSNVPLLSVTTLATQSEQIAVKLMKGATTFNLAGWEVSVRDASVLAAVGLVVTLTGALLYLFLRTNLGMAMPQRPAPCR